MSQDVSTQHTTIRVRSQHELFKLMHVQNLGKLLQIGRAFRYRMCETGGYLEDLNGHDPDLSVASVVAVDF